jgi:2-keto-3-deoxy-L-rhamnonate aldolase RhmA
MPTFSQRVRAGQPVLGCFAFLPSPGLVEVMGGAGLDFVIIDQEHCRKSWQTVEEMVRAAQLSGMAALVRVARIEDAEILHALETGAHGLVLPFVESAADVSQAASAMRYPPEGRRGTCTQTRAAGYGARRQDYMAWSRQCNRELLLIGQIESLAGLANIEEIVAVESGLDVVFLGRSDLAMQMGKPGQTSDPEVELACSTVIETARRAKRHCGLAHYQAEECRHWARQGCSFFALASEVGFLMAQLQAFGRETRATLVASSATE